MVGPTNRRCTYFIAVGVEPVSPGTKGLTPYGHVAFYLNSADVVPGFAVSGYCGACSGNPGGSMPRYLSRYTLACLTRQGAVQLTERIFSASSVKAGRVQVSMIEGKMLVEFDAADRDTLEAWFKAEGFHYEWLIRIEYESEAGKLVPLS
jgi:hypothetical protein